MYEFSFLSLNLHSYIPYSFHLLFKLFSEEDLNSFNLWKHNRPILFQATVRYIFVNSKVKVTTQSLSVTLRNPFTWCMYAYTVKELASHWHIRTKLFSLILCSYSDASNWRPCNSIQLHHRLMFFFFFCFMYYAISVAAGFGLEVLLRNELKIVYDGRQFNFKFNRIGVAGWYGIIWKSCL